MRLTAVTLAALGMLVAAAPVAAQDPPPPTTPDDSAVSQYVEAVPSASGPKAPGVGKGKPRPLPAKVEAHVKAAGGADSKALERLATSPTLGAPTHAAPAAPAAPSVPATHATPATHAAPAAQPSHARPTRSKNLPRARERHVGSAPTGHVSTGRRLSAAVTAVQDGGGTRFVFLALTLLAITVAIGWAATRRARRRLA